MVELLGGAEIPIQVGMGLESTIGGGDIPIDISGGFGPSPAESAAIIAEAERLNAERVAAEWEASQREKLAVMETTAQEAHETYYEVGGTGYGTTPGGPDVVYYGDTVLYESEPGSLMPLGWEAPSWPDLSLPEVPDKYLLAGGLIVAALFLK